MTQDLPPTPSVTVGVLALQGAFIEHITLLHQAAKQIQQQQQQHLALASDHVLPARTGNGIDPTQAHFHFLEVRTEEQLQSCDALIIPGGESTSISLIAERCGLLEPLRQYVKVARRPVWGTCAGLILLAESANKSKETGQELIGGLDVRVHRNYFGRQVESFEADLDMPFLEDGPFHSVFIRAPVVEKVLSAAKAVDKADEKGDTVLAPPRQGTDAPVEILGRLPGRARAIRDKTTTAEELGEDGDIVAVRQGNVFGTAFHPELTGDDRIHAWWLKEVLRLKLQGQL